MEKKSNHRVNIVRLGEPRVHTNADKLELWDIEGYQVVSQKGQFKAGELAVYVQPDSVVPQTEPFKFIWEPYLTLHKSELDGATVEGDYDPVPERRRRITVRKFRGEWSEGLLLPITDFSGGLQHEPKLNYGWLKEGDDVSEVLGITHWDPEIAENTKGDNEVGPRRYKKFPRSLKGWFYWLLYHVLGYNPNGNHHGFGTEQGPGFPVYDVEALKNFKNVLQPGELVHVTEKIHGSNARYVFIKGHMYVGSRTQWKAASSNCVWRKALTQHPEIEEWCIANEGAVLYGEVVPTQGAGFNYGHTEGAVGFFAFDVLLPDGSWDWPGNQGFGLNVPVVRANVPYSDELLKLADGSTLVPGAKHIREGVVIRALNQRHVRGLNRVQLKVVSNAFLEKDSKEK